MKTNGVMEYWSNGVTRLMQYAVHYSITPLIRHPML
jgi:hypothetical protein